MEPLDLKRLAENFPAEDIEWRVGRSGKNDKGIYATCLAYVTNRAIMNRLDDVCGPAGWRNEYKEWKVGDKHGVLCGISIKVGEEWVTKWDGSDTSDIEPIKGGFSDSMKRAGVQWGIGRYLYDLDEGFAQIVAKGNGAKYAKTKEGEQFYWLPPALPAWALPAGEKTKAPKVAPKSKPTRIEAMEAISDCVATKAVDTIWSALTKYEWSAEDMAALEECKKNRLTMIASTPI